MVAISVLQFINLFHIRIFFKLYFCFIWKSLFLALSLSLSHFQYDVYATFTRTLPASTSTIFLSSSFSIPFGFSLRLLRLFHSALPPPSRGNSGATLAVDINKHLDYTVKAASTTSPD